MLTFAASQRIYLAVEPVDMRKQFNGLWALAIEKLREDPFAGSLFVFTNKDRNRLKILFWDGSGVWVLANTHAPHCPQWFNRKDPVSISPALWKGV